MPPETCKVELSVEFVPVSPERMAAYRQALRILAELVMELVDTSPAPSMEERHLERDMQHEAQSVDGADCAR